jgi:hypothetical protein
VLKNKATGHTAREQLEILQAWKRLLLR